MIASALRWVSFLWGIGALVVMGYSAYRWFPDPANAGYGELQLIFVLAAYAGAPAWLCLPILGLAQRRSLGGWRTAAHFLLPLAVGVLYLWGRSLMPEGF
ncbi:MAG: hypothetical protein KDI71_22050 [Xanthomonadales bacterium]|nr:hypothetical protein [Xanthomonadales bacterium]